MKYNMNLAGLACYVALMCATVLLIIEYAFNMSGGSWARYISIAKDVAIAIGIVFGSWAYVKNRNFLVKFLFAISILVYITFAILVVIY